MKRIIKLLCGLFAFGLQSEARAQRSPDLILSESKPAIVHVEIAPAAGSLDKPARGSGFFIGSEGVVLTAKHVLAAFKDEGTTPIVVRIGSPDASPLSAEIVNVATSVPIDVGVLKIKGQAPAQSSTYETVGRG